MQPKNSAKQLRESATVDRFESLGNNGALYFIESPDGKFVKIGYSEGLHARFEAMGQRMPGLRMIGWIPGSVNDEKRLHARCKEERETGEWFRHSIALREIIRPLRLRPLAAFPARKPRPATPSTQLTKSIAATVHIAGNWHALKEAASLKTGTLDNLIRFTTRFSTRMDRRRQEELRDMRTLKELLWLKRIVIRYSKGKGRAVIVQDALDRRANGRT